MIILSFFCLFLPTEHLSSLTCLQPFLSGISWTSQRALRVVSFMFHFVSSEFRTEKVNRLCLRKELASFCLRKRMMRTCQSSAAQAACGEELVYSVHLPT